MKLSLQGRLLLAALLVLALFTGLTGLALDKAFRESAEAAMQDRMEGYLFALLAAVDLDTNGIPAFTRNLPDARFDQPGSGLYARVMRKDGEASLAAPSLLGSELTSDHQPHPGEQIFTAIQVNGTPHYLLSYGASWEVAPGKEYPLFFQIAEDTTGYLQQINRYRRNLWGWLATAAFILLVAQALILRWGLKPLRQVTDDLARIETGQTDKLHGHYPKELQQLTDKINDLLSHTRSQLVRYRDSLGNMAHSLKTPLTILGNAMSLDKTDRDSTTDAQEQLQRIRQIIDYQLQRAATAGQSSASIKVTVRPLVERIVTAMEKVYAAKSVHTDLQLDNSLTCRCDEGDAVEMLGNLIENAFKWCNSRIRISAHAMQSDGVKLCVEDDGPGIPETIRSRVLERGQRADPATAGHGIGLAMVQEIVLLYDGTLTIEQSPLGGAAIYIQLP